MFGSLKGRIFLIVVLVVGLIAGFVMLFSQRQIEQAMFDSEERSARNVLELVTVDVESRHQNLIREKLSTIAVQRDRLEELGGIVARTLDGFADLADGRTAMNDAEARAAALAWVSDFRPSPGEYAMIVGPGGTILAAGNEALVGTDAGDYRDFKNRPLIEAAREDARGTTSAFLTFRLPEPEGDSEAKFGYFFSFPHWYWQVAVAADVGDIERDADRRLGEIISGLTETLQRVRIAESGYVFIFSGDGETVVPPPEPHAGILDAANNLTDNPLREDLMRAAEAGGRDPVAFRASSQAATWESRVGYFKPLDWYIVASASREEIRAPAEALVQRQGAIFLGVLVLALGLAYGYAAHIARPLNRLAEHARRLPERDLLAADGESPIADMPARHRDEVGRLAETFLYMERQLRENVLRMMDAAAQAQHIESELKIAQEIQLGLLPTQPPALAEKRHIELKARMRTAKEVGGDLYDYFALDKDRMCFAVGDVSGKGVPAALFMAITKTLLRAAAEADSRPGAILANVNDALIDNNPNMMFATLFVGVLDVRNGQLDYASAGHPPPLLRTAAGELHELDGRSGPACGVVPDVAYDDFATELAFGDIVIGYTDGVTEAMNQSNEEFGIERLKTAVSRDGSSPADALAESVMDTVRTFAAGAVQSDDIVLFALRYLSKTRSEPSEAEPALETETDASHS